MYKYKTRGVCASYIQFELTEDKRVKNVSFYGGCNGNLKAISKLVDGMKAEDVIRILKGNTCGFKSTSCADQLALAIEEAISKS
ncbi:MAG: TIGR03905 family TSCPD domain-containing protein [Ruminococcaceae bacterium]|nr:TIGR03905 family TSCPD domain-containing protein [Oscillospiraceae bacterium]